MLPLSLNKGDRVVGRVSHIAPFGAFVDFGDWHGLLRIPEISRIPIHHPSDVLSLGQEIETEIIHIDREHNQVSLSLKRCQDNP